MSNYENGCIDCGSFNFEYIDVDGYENQHNSYCETCDQQICTDCARKRYYNDKEFIYCKRCCPRLPKKKKKLIMTEKHENELFMLIQKIDKTTQEFDRAIYLAGKIIPKNPLKSAHMFYSKQFNKQKEKLRVLHERRLNVSRVAMRAGIPSDLVPLICAFAVPDSKKYSYMKIEK